MDSLLMHFHGMLSNIAKKLIMRLIISFFFSIFCNEMRSSSLIISTPNNDMDRRVALAVFGHIPIHCLARCKSV